MTILLLYHDNVTPFMLRQYYPLIGRFFFLGAPACDSLLEESASAYSSGLVLLEVSPANYPLKCRLSTKPSQAKVLTGGGDLRKRKSTSPYLLAIPAVARKAVLNNRHLNSNMGICLN